MSGPDGFDGFQEKSKNFIEWLQTSGAQISSKIELADLRYRSAGRGVLAKADIEEDEELFSIPRSLILDTNTSSLPEDLRNKLDDPWLSLILAMIREQSLGKSSAFAPYFDVLPDTFDTLMYWTKNELEYLKGSSVVDKVGKASADASFRDKIILVVREHSEIFNAVSLTEDEVLSLCHRMGSLIMAYAFDLEGPSSAAAQNGDEEWEEDSDYSMVLPKGMIPLADMLNADADRNNAKLFYEDDGSVVMKTIQPVKSGEELFNDFGSLPRADLLRRYGYITDNYAQYDVVEISNNLIREAVRHVLDLNPQSFDKRLEFLAEHGLEEDSWDVARVTYEDGQFSEELRVFLNTISMAPKDFDKLRGKDKLPKAELSERALRLLQDTLARRAETYPRDNVKPTAANGVNGTTQEGRRLEMAKAVIEGEKQVLQEAQATVQALINAGAGDKRKADSFAVGAEASHEKKKQKR